MPKLLPQTTTCLVKRYEGIFYTILIYALNLEVAKPIAISTNLLTLWQEDTQSIALRSSFVMKTKKRSLGSYLHLNNVRFYKLTKSRKVNDGGTEGFSGKLKYGGLN